jgi:hypothetical protein
MIGAKNVLKKRKVKIIVGESNHPIEIRFE